MQICCPVCDSAFPIAAGFAEADGKRLAVILAEFEPTLGRAMIGYLSLFKPGKTQLRLARAAKLAAEVKALVDEGSVAKDERTGVRRQATPVLWTAGIEMMLAQRATLTLPLDSHGYLRAVVFGLADKVDAQAEREREKNLQAGRRTPTSSPASSSRLAEALDHISQMENMGAYSPADAETKRAEAHAKFGSKS